MVTEKITFDNFSEKVGLFKSENTYNGDIAHMVLGINEELEELEEAIVNEGKLFMDVETQEKNIREECSDLFWFSSQLYRVNDMNFSQDLQYFISTTEANFNNINYTKFKRKDCISPLMGLAKRFIGNYSKEKDILKLPTEIKKSLSYIVEQVYFSYLYIYERNSYQKIVLDLIIDSQLCDESNPRHVDKPSFTEYVLIVLQNNFDKLSVRYKGQGFDASNAVNRDKKAEYDAI